MQSFFSTAEIDEVPSASVRNSTEELGVRKITQIAFIIDIHRLTGHVTFHFSAAAKTCDWFGIKGSNDKKKGKKKKKRGAM
jgi:hypothetical protein